jgi:hypothetical protein
MINSGKIAAFCEVKTNSGLLHCGVLYIYIDNKEVIEESSAQVFAMTILLTLWGDVCIIIASV